MVKIMPPFVGIGQTTWFRGTSDAIFRNLNFVHDQDPQDVIILSGEHIYHMNYKHAIEFHHAHNANLTIVGKRMPRECLSLRFGYLKEDKKHRVTFFKEKPKEFLSDFISMGIYIFKKDFLINLLYERAESGPTQNLVFDVIEPIASGPGVFAYEFKGYWEYLETVQSYYEANMELLKNDPPIKPGEWEIATNMEDRALASRPPKYFCCNAQVKDSLISPGGDIAGKLVRSVLSPGVIIEQGAIVEDSIIMHDCLIKKGARLKNLIADKNVVFERDCMVGGGRVKKGKNPEIPPSTKKLTIVGKGAVIGEKVKIACNSQVYPNKDLSAFEGTEFPSGINIK